MYISCIYQIFCCAENSSVNNIFHTIPKPRDLHEYFVNTTAFNVNYIIMYIFTKAFSLLLYT